MGAATLEGSAVIHRLSGAMQTSAHDIGRLSTGELLWVSAPDGQPENPAESTPRFFDPPTVLLRERPEASEHPPGPTPELSVDGLMARVHALRSFQLLAVLPRRHLILGAVVIVILIALVFIVSSGASKSTPTTTPVATASSSATAEPVGVTDPSKASIDFAMAGELPALGPIQGLPRSAFVAVITNRSGDFVLIDVYVTKAAGEKTFATVLLQKAGTQWRMREVFDARV